MPLTGYLKIPDVPGESQRADHEDEIVIHGMKWEVAQASSAAAGRGRRRARADIKALVVRKSYDRASPYIALAVQQGRAFSEVVLSLRKDSGDQHLDYLVITMENVLISAYTVASYLEGVPDDLLSEMVVFEFEKISLRYTMQADDHSAGSEYEVTLSQ